MEFIETILHCLCCRLKLQIHNPKKFYQTHSRHFQNKQKSIHSMLPNSSSKHKIACSYHYIRTNLPASKSTNLKPFRIGQQKNESHGHMQHAHFRTHKRRTLFTIRNKFSSHILRLNPWKTYDQIMHDWNTPYSEISFAQ
jgi:hypothetical protein